MKTFKNYDLAFWTSRKGLLSETKTYLEGKGFKVSEELTRDLKEADEAISNLSND